MRALIIYADSSVVGGCEDPGFAADTLPLWERFVEGRHRLVLSEVTLRELLGAPQRVRAHVRRVPREHQVVLPDSDEASELGAAYAERGILGPGSRTDALHVALATVARVDVLVSWNFRHIVNLGRIRLFNAVNIERGYGILEIRTPKEVLEYDDQD